jgi:hypothetical protein
MLPFQQGPSTQEVTSVARRTIDFGSDSIRIQLSQPWGRREPGNLVSTVSPLPVAPSEKPPSGPHAVCPTRARYCTAGPGCRTTITRFAYKASRPVCPPDKRVKETNTRLRTLEDRVPALSGSVLNFSGQRSRAPELFHEQTCKHM